MPLRSLKKTFKLDYQPIEDPKIRELFVRVEKYLNDIMLELATTSADAVDVGAITGSHIPDGSITTAKLDADAVTGAKLADNAVDNEHLADAAVDTAELADSAVTAAKINNNAVIGGKIANGAVSTGKLFTSTGSQAGTVSGSVTISFTNGYTLSVALGGSGGANFTVMGVTDSTPDPDAPQWTLNTFASNAYDVRWRYVA